MEANARKGTTLIELILFIGITAMMTGVVLSFSLLSTQVGMRSEILADIEHAGSFATEYISQKVQASDTVHVSSGELEVIKDGVETVFSLENDMIKVVENGTDVSYITPENLRVDDLDFVLLGATATSKRGVTISFDIANKESGVAKMPDYDLRFHMTVAGR